MIRFDNLRFLVVNNGLDVWVGEDKVARLDPTESMELLKYLELNREEFQRAIDQKEEAALGSTAWENQKLAEYFNNMPEN